MVKIIIQELERDDQPISDIWATIQFKSEKENLDVQFQLEKLLDDWDVRKMQSFDYLRRLSQWIKIAENNGFEIEMAENLKIEETILW